MRTFSLNVFYNLMKYPVACTIVGAVTVTAATKVLDVLGIDLQSRKTA